MSGAFLGTFENSLSNRRVSIPLDFRNQFAVDAKNRVTVVRGKMNTLYIYPHDNWKKLEEKLNNGSDLHQEILRNLRLYATVLEIEGPGRILIPKNLLEIVKVDKKVIFLGEGNFFSLWNPKKFEEYRNQIDKKYDEMIEENINLL